MKMLFTLMVIIILAAGGYYLYMQSAPATTVDTDMTPEMQMESNTGIDATQPTPAPTPTTSGTPSDVNIAVDGSVSTGELREITVTSTGMSFNQKEITVKKGDRVRITYANGGGTHDLRIAGYDVGTKVMSAGQSETFEFVADETGEFQYYCSVGNHRAMGMWGTLTVE